MNVERIINVFNKSDDELVEEIKANLPSLDILKSIFNPNEEDDPLMYYCYPINEIEGKELRKYIEVEFDFNKYVYSLDCYQA